MKLHPPAEAPCRAPRRDGFTLIEILIVISIIAVLTSMVATGVIFVRQQANETLAITQVDRIKTAIEAFKADEGYYPGAKITDPGRNAFPAVYEALMGERRPHGKGGRNAPYLKDIRESDILVFDDTLGEKGEYRKATRDERLDPKVEKFIMDPWGNPYWYRENKSKKANAYYMHNRHSFDIWSLGPNKENDTLNEEEDDKKNDDKGNW